ncbi:protein MGARP-like isoform X4 [Megalops cyprinoides]|nr:protein MGARP-like isoform X4 [Megalops cyprinoides]
MYLCRAAWQKLGPLTRKSVTQLSRNVIPMRTMSSGVPGGSGQNIVYFLLCGGSLAAAVTYAYKTVTSDHERFNDRVSEIRARPKTEWQPKPWPPKGEGEEE